MKRAGSLIAAVAILIVAIGVALSHHNKLEMQHESEAQLRHELMAMRRAIASYRAKHQHGPGSLEELVPGELRSIPADPITKSSTTWKTTVEESVRVDDFQPGSAKSAPSITDVHSGASGNDSAGRPFSDY